MTLLERARPPFCSPRPRLPSCGRLGGRSAPTNSTRRTAVAQRSLRGPSRFGRASACDSSRARECICPRLGVRARLRRRDHVATRVSYRYFLHEEQADPVTDRVGSRLPPRLVDAGIDVRVLVRSGKRISDGVNAVEGDMLDATELRCPKLSPMSSGAAGRAGRYSRTGRAAH